MVSVVLGMLNFIANICFALSSASVLLVIWRIEKAVSTSSVIFAVWGVTALAAALSQLLELLFAQDTLSLLSICYIVIMLVLGVVGIRASVLIKAFATNDETSKQKEATY